MKVLNPLLGLLYPYTCVCCSKNLLDGEKLICIECRHDLPFFDNKDYVNNSLRTVFEGRLNLQMIGAFLIFQKHGKVKNMIHELKYRGNQDIGFLIGNWWSLELKKQEITQEINCIIPVPLHPKKERKRGYNQLTTFGKVLSKNLDIPYYENILIRKTSTKTQTYKNRFERFLNTETKFEIPDKNKLSNKHVLLIDDVITTGATIVACAQELEKCNNIKTSVLSIAFTA